MNLPAYRLTLYLPRIEDPTEATVLTPAAGAPHSDDFIVTTMQGVSGAQPYLETPRGRHGSLDPVTRKMTTGNINVAVFDKRTSTTNADRWVTAFIGDAEGRLRLKGCRAVMERSLDAGGAWDPYFAGRVRDVALDGDLRLSLDLKDGADELNRSAFLGTPDSSIDYAARAALLPVGVPIAFGSIAATELLRGTLTTDQPAAGPVRQQGRITLDVTQDGGLGLITKRLKDAQAGKAQRVVASIPSIGTVNLVWPTRFIRPELAIGSSGATMHYRPQLLYIETIPGDPSSTIPATVGNTEAITFYVTEDSPPTKDLPLLIGDVHPVQLMADIIDGKFSLASGSTTLRPLGARNTSLWNALIADASFGTCRFVIEKSWKANAFMEQCLCLPYGLAITIDAAGEVVPIDLRPAASVTLAATLTDADVVAGEAMSWADSRDGAITAVEYHYFSDRATTRENLDALPDTYPTLSPTLLVSSEGIVFQLNDVSTLLDVGEKIVKIVAPGTRITEGDEDPDGNAVQGTVLGRIEAAIDDFLVPFQSGTLTFKVPYRVSSAAADVAVGDYLSANHSKLPNPATNQRGGARLALVLGRSETGGTVWLELLDFGAAASAAVPSITSCTIATYDPNAIDVVVAANAAGDEVVLWAAVTAASVGSAPAATAASWRRVGAITGSGTVRTGAFPRGKRVWFRARSQAIGERASAPSAWVFPTPAYVDLATLTACSALLESSVYANRVDLSWTNGDATLDVELYLATGGVPGTWTAAMLQHSHAPGTTTARVGTLATSTAYTAGVRVRDEGGGASAMATRSFSTGATLGVAPDPEELDLATGGLA